MKNHFAWLGAVTLASVLLTGCPRSEDDVITVAGLDAAPPDADINRDAAAPHDARPPTDAPAVEIWPASATLLEATEGLGFGPAPSPACMARFTYTFVRATRTFSWDRCTTRTDATRSQGSRMLSAAEITRLESAAAQVKVVARRLCLPDGGGQQFTVTTPQGGQTYVESDSCENQPGVTYVDDIHVLFAELRALAQSPVVSDAGAPDTAPSGPVWPANATALDASEGLGYGPAPSPACRDSNTYGYVRATRTFTWDRCVTRIESTRSKGTRVLSLDEAARLEAAAAGMSVAAPNAPCGADKGLLQATVKTPTQAATYVDGFYRCNMQPGVTYVDGIDSLFRVLRELPQP